LDWIDVLQEEWEKKNERVIELERTLDETKGEIDRKFKNYQEMVKDLGEMSPYKQLCKPHL
jgi:hypothetical protein